MKFILPVGPLWRYGLNLRSTIAFRRQCVSLNAESTRVLRDLNADGVAETTLEKLTGDPGLLAALQGYAAALEDARADAIKEQAAALAGGVELGNGQDEKLFVVTLLDQDRPVIELHEPLAVTGLNEQVKGVADSYYRMRTRVTDVNIWRNLPTGRGPVASQLWHRDLRADHLMLKMFIYLEDVCEANGPYAYVKGTHVKGDTNWRPKSTFDGYNWRVTDEEVSASIEPDRRPEFTGPAGTLVFADTTGWHKGGHALTEPRLVVQILFASRRALPDRRLGAPAHLNRAAATPDLAFDPKTFRLPD